MSIVQPVRWLVALCGLLALLTAAPPLRAQQAATAKKAGASQPRTATALCLVDVSHEGQRWYERDMRKSLERALRSRMGGSLARRRQFVQAARKVGVRRDDWLSPEGLPKVAAELGLDLAITAEVVGRGARRRLLFEALDGASGEVRARVSQPMPRNKLSKGEAEAAVDALMSKLDASETAYDDDDDDDGDGSDPPTDGTSFSSDSMDFDEDAEDLDEDEAPQVEFEARVAVQHHSYVHDDELDPVGRNGVEAGLQVTGGLEWASATASVLFRHDFSDEARNRIDLDEAFVDVGPAWLSLRGGRLIESWGAASLYNPSDVLNPRDFRDPIDLEKLGVWALRLRSVIGPVSLAGYLLPVPEAHTLPPITALDDRGLPTSSSRWFRRFPTPVPGPIVTSVVAGGPPEAQPRNVQGAFRAGLSLAGIDMALGYAYLYDRMPSLRLAFTPPPAPGAPTVIEASLENPRMHVGMLEAERAFGGLRVAAEGVLLARRFGSDEGVESPSPYIIAVAGADYRVAQIADIHELHFFLEGLTSQAFDGELPSDPVGRIRYLARWGALGRVRYELDAAFFVEANAFTNLEAYELYFGPSAGYRFFERVTLELGADLFFGKSDTVMGSYRRNKRITFELVGEI